MSFLFSGTDKAVIEKLRVRKRGKKFFISNISEIHKEILLP